MIFQRAFRYRYLNFAFDVLTIDIVNLLGLNSMIYFVDTYLYNFGLSSSSLIGWVLCIRKTMRYDLFNNVVCRQKLVL